MFSSREQLKRPLTGEGKQGSRNRGEMQRLMDFGIDPAKLRQFARRARPERSRTQEGLKDTKV